MLAQIVTGLLPEWARPYLKGESSRQGGNTKVTKRKEGWGSPATPADGKKEKSKNEKKYSGSFLHTALEGTPRSTGTVLPEKRKEVLSVFDKTSRRTFKENTMGRSTVKDKNG